MKNLITYLKNTNIWVLVLFILVWFKGCSNSSDIKTLRKEVVRLETKNDSLNTEMIKAIQAEGLRSEKRMIQSTDRKMMDVNRMSEIDKELKTMGK
jgi:uncharacterized protein YcfL